MEWGWLGKPTPFLKGIMRIRIINLGDEYGRSRYTSKGRGV
jgi:hypothetical protein